MFKKPIAIFGGTFDPIHFGHLRTALEIYDKCQLAEVHFIPCYQPVHRERPVASPQDRLNMISLAIKDEPVFKVDDCEIKRQGPSYMVDTLETFRANISDQTPLCLIMGIDALLGFAQWHRYDDILKLAHLIIAHRPDYQLPESGTIADLLKSQIKKEINSIHQNLCGSIILQTVSALEISATQIRKGLEKGKNPRFLLPDSVYEYIKQHGIYRSNSL